MTSCWVNLHLKTRRDLRVACCLWRQQVGAGRGSYEVVAGAQGKGGQNMAIWRRVPGQNETKNDFSKLESPFETNHIEFVAPGLFQHFAVWSVSLWRLVGTWILQVVQASLAYNSTSCWRWARNVATFDLVQQWKWNEKKCQCRWQWKFHKDMCLWYQFRWNWGVAMIDLELIS